MKRSEKFDTTPIVNYVFEWSDEEKAAFHDQMMAMHRAPRTVALNAYKREEWATTVGFYKAILGDQSYTWVGEYRFWVWERADWRLFVSNIQEVSFEAKAGLTKEQAKAAWDGFRALIGLHCPYNVGQRVLVYSDDEPGVFKGPDDDYPGHGYVLLDSGKKESIHFDQLRPA